MQPKAAPADFLGRFREIISDPINLLIWRDPRAGQVTHDQLVFLHNGLRVPVSGPYAYYDGFSTVLALNRGVHEPLEEFVFQEVVRRLPEQPRMLELGAYWGHYSMWLKKERPLAGICMVEPEAANIKAGINNFNLNGMRGEVIQAFVGRGKFEVDQYMVVAKKDHLDILHCDIQGYELEMFEGAAATLAAHKADYVFVSTHSQALHHEVKAAFVRHGYRVEVDSDFEAGSTSFDGLVFATSPNVPPVFDEFKAMDRVDLEGAQPERLLAYLSSTRRSCAGLVKAEATEGHPLSSGAWPKGLAQQSSAMGPPSAVQHQPMG